MKCREVRRLIYLYREGELPYETRRQIQQHVASCQRCSLEMQQSGDAGRFTEMLRSVEPQLHARRDLTEQIMRAVESAHANESRPHPQAVFLPSRRLQLACTAAAALIAAVFFVQNGIDIYRMASLESRLNQSPAVLIATPGEHPLAALGLNTIAEFGRLVTGPLDANKIGLRGKMQLREAVRSFLGVLRESPPGFAGEVRRLRAKYPELWFISPIDGLTDHDRLVLSRQGKALMKDLRALIQQGKSDYEK
ncbi:zf-HC2 domain-containing protein [bacterium]|nr:MAG: zf-HC2 domain-containing protein [bacterium]